VCGASRSRDDEKRKGGLCRAGLSPIDVVRVDFACPSSLALWTACKLFLGTLALWDKSVARQIHADHAVGAQLTSVRVGSALSSLSVRLAPY
jgi:hypothetical protein